MGMTNVTTDALMRGIDSVNRKLLEMCGGEQLVYFKRFQEWAYEPNAYALEFVAEEGAPEDAIALAEKVKSTWSYSRLTIQSDRAIDRDYLTRTPIRWTFCLL